MGANAGETGLLKKGMYGTRDAARNWERDWQEHIKSWVYQLGQTSKNLFRYERHRVSRMTHGDDFRAHETRAGSHCLCEWWIWYRFHSEFNVGNVSS